MDILVDHISPLPGYVLIAPQEEDSITGSAGKFDYADSVEDQEAQKIGKIIAIGESYITEKDKEIDCPKGVAVGTVVIHKQYGADKLKYNNQEVRFVRFQDLVGVVNV